MPVRDLHTYIFECDDCGTTARVQSTASSTDCSPFLEMFHMNERPAGWGSRRLYDGSGYGGGGAGTYVFCPKCLVKYKDRVHRWRD